MCGSAVGLAVVGLTACFSEPGAVSNGSSSGTVGSDTSASVSTTSSADATTQTSRPGETTTSLDPDSSDGTRGADSTTAGSEGSTGSTGGDAVWLCADQPDLYACESFERRDDFDVPWTEETVDQVTVSLESDPTSGNHQRYTLNGGDGMHAQSSVTLNVLALQTIHIEFATRFHESVDGCSTGTGGDLTMISMVRASEAGPDEQLILQVGPTHATLYATGLETADVIVLEPSQELDEWFQVVLDVDMASSTATLDVGGATAVGKVANWEGSAVQEALDVSFGPASDNDGDTFEDCQFDLDNVLLTTE